jgi:hypothetical protein
MKKQILFCILIAISWPRTAIASGGDVLLLLLLEIGLFIAVLVGILVFRLGLKRSAVIFSCYLLSSFIAIGITNQIPYLDNLLLINTICIGVPLLVWMVSLNYFLRLEKNNKKPNK